MAVLRQCLCYTLRQGSFIIGIYALIVYCVAFAVELWWIVESLFILPAPAYTLCALYFFNFIMAAVLLFGLLIRQRKYLMSWTLMTILSFFPEAGMVLFMSVYYWPSHKEEYATIELVFFAFRAFFNILGIYGVCSLYLNSRNEEFILSRLHDLTLANVETMSMGGGGMLPRNGTLHRNSHLNLGGVGTLKGSKSNLAYQNFAYMDSSITGIGLVGENNYKNNSFISRNNFGGSRSHLNSASIMNNDSPQNNLRASLMRMKSEFNPAMMFDPALRKSRISELGIAGIGLEPPGQPPSTIGLGGGMHRTRSLWNVTNDDYWNRPPPSRPVSLGYVNHVHQMDNEQSNYFQQHVPHSNPQNNNSQPIYQYQHQYQPQVDHSYHPQQLYPSQQTQPQYLQPFSKNTLLRKNNSNHLLRVQSSNALTNGYNNLYYDNANLMSGLNNQFAKSGSGVLTVNSVDLDRRRNPMSNLFAGARRAQSMDGININNNNAIFYQRYYGQNITLQQQQQQQQKHMQQSYPHFHVLNYDPLQHGESGEEDWSKSSLQDQDIRSYQDIPL